MIGILSGQLVVSQQSSGTSGRSVHVSVHSDLCPVDRPLDFLVGRNLSLPLFWHVDTDQDAGTDASPDFCTVWMVGTKCCTTTGKSMKAAPVDCEPV